MRLSKEVFEFLKNLKKGDVIFIDMGLIRKVKVLENYPDMGKIKLRRSIGFFGIMNYKFIEDYKYCGFSDILILNKK